MRPTTNPAGRSRSSSTGGRYRCPGTQARRFSKAPGGPNDALMDDEVAEGYVLTCQAVPDTAQVAVSYDE
jgi:hypothetical protein